MDEISDRDLGEALRSAAEDAEREERPTIMSVARALRARISGPDEPLREIVTALEYYPVEDDVPDHPEVVPLWARAFACAPRPLIGARFADLLWNARFGDIPQWAPRAVDGYLAAVADGFGHLLEITEGLQRALAIATEIGDQPRRAAVIEELVGLADRAMENEPRSPGVALSIVGSLADQPAADRPDQLRPLLERAVDRYREDPWLLEPALDIKARLVEPAERERLRVAQVDAFVRVARRDAGIVRYVHYEHAIDLAERHELPALAARLRAELADPSAKPNEAVEGFVDHIVGNDSLGEALARFGAALPTEGHTGRVDPTEVERLSFFGVLAVDLLARIRERYGAVSAAAVWFECPLIEPMVATLIAHGSELYESGDFAAAVSVLALQLERITRSVASAAGLAEIPSDGAVGEVVDALAGTLYEPTRRYLRALLPETPPDATAPHAALLVHAACHLRLLQPVEVTRALPGA
jgi:hypothetical protein